MAADSSPTNGVVRVASICCIRSWKYAGCRGSNALWTWRLPGAPKPACPKGVWNRAVSPGGGTSGFPATVPAGPSPRRRPARREAVLLRCLRERPIRGFGEPAGHTAGGPRDLRQPGPGCERTSPSTCRTGMRVRVFAVGLDADAELRPPPPFAQPRPSSAMKQDPSCREPGRHPAQTYPAALARRLNLDFVNWASAAPARPSRRWWPWSANWTPGPICLTWASPTARGAGRYNRMLDAIRAAHPTAPFSA